MITDKTLIVRVQRIISSKPRRFVSAADVLAVIQKESGGVGYFTGQEPLYKANLAAAADITGLSKDQIIKAVTYPDASKYAGFLYKFRCEPGYWTWASKLKGSWSGEQRFLLSCSFGLGQKMARWLLSGVPGARWMPFLELFNENQDLQVQYCAGDLDQLMAAAKDHNRLVAYTRYNEGFRLDKRTGKPIEWISDYGRVVGRYAKAYREAGLP